MRVDYTKFFLIPLICIFKIQDLKEYFEERSRKSKFKKLSVGNIENIPTSNVKLLFTLESKDILIANRIISNDGKILKSISKIKDPAERFAAESIAEMSFYIDMYTGSVYKVLNFINSCHKFTYRIPYQEVNKYIVMNPNTYDKYKSINSDNWEKFI